MPEKEYMQMFGKSRETAVSEAKEELQKAMREKDREKAKELFKKLKKVFVGDDVFWANEVASNIFVAIVMIIFGAILILTIILDKAGVYDFNNTSVIPVFSACIAEMLVGIVLTFVYHGEKKWLKHLDMFLVCVTVAAVNAFLGYRSAIFLTVPMILSTKYLSEKFTQNVSILSGIFLLTSTITSAFSAVSVDLNTVAYAPGTQINIVTTLAAAVKGLPVDTHTYLANLLMRSFLPNLFQFLLVAYICRTIAKWGHKTILTQQKVSADFARVDTELNMARDIQANILPRLFPAFPERKEFDLYAAMDPAREVGGDFYDFFMVDDDHLGIVMADVSGKGVPAALFMMIGKVLIKNRAQDGGKPSEVFSYVNNELCENNQEELFITAWLGILEISTGHIIACNAGHEYPMIRRSGSDYELFKDKHGFVLAGLQDYPYKDYEFDLHPGDSLFIYTDGCTEATSSNVELFGTDRLLNALRHHEGDKPMDTVKKVRKDIDAFVGKAPQFDDITMLELNYNGPKKKGNKKEKS